MPLTKGTPVCFGADPRWLTLPIVNLPPDAVRVIRRARPDQIAVAFVRTPDGLSRYHLAPADGQTLKDCEALKLLVLTAANKRDKLTA